MKKLLAIGFISSLVLASCSKKEVSTESNRMLEEPEVTVTDTAKAVSNHTVVVTPEITPVQDSAAVKK